MRVFVIFCGYIGLRCPRHQPNPTQPKPQPNPIKLALHYNAHVTIKNEDYFKRYICVTAYPRPCEKNRLDLVGTRTHNLLQISPPFVLQDYFSIPFLYGNYFLFSLCASKKTEFNMSFQMIVVHINVHPCSPGPHCKTDHSSPLVKHITCVIASTHFEQMGFLQCQCHFKLFVIGHA